MDFSQFKFLVLCTTVLALKGCVSASKSTEYVNPQALQVASMVGDAQPGDQVALPTHDGLGTESVVVDRSYIAASGRQCRRFRTVDGTPVQRVACRSNDGVWLMARDLRPISSIDRTVSDATPMIIVSTEYTVEEYAVPVESVPPQLGAADASMLERAESSLIISRAEHARRIGARLLSVSPDNYSAQISSEPLPVATAGPAFETVQRVVNVNETLWSFAKRITGSGLNWERIAHINGITDAKKLAAGTLLFIPVELVGQGG